jgi:hypothetical protein
MSIFQITAIFFALFMMYVISIHRRKAALNTLEISFWYSTWILFIIISIFPNLLLGVSGILNFSRVFDLLIVVAFMIISLLVFKTYLLQKETDKKIEQLIRDTAHQERLKDVKTKA